MRRAAVPRKPRIVHTGGIYHVVNRGNDKRVIYPQADEYEHFLALLQEGRSHAPVSIVAYCLMPTHFHLVLIPLADGALSTYMHRVTGSYASGLRQRTRTRGFGHVFQRRFWAAPVSDHEAFVCVLRYVEGNARRAGLVARAQEWRWTSLTDRMQESPQIINVCPLALPGPWPEWVNLGQDESVLTAIRRALRRMK